MIRRSAVLGLVVASLSLLAPGGASAFPSEGDRTGPVDCTFQVTMRFAFPPLPGSKVESEAGHFDCSGQVINGQEVVGPGEYSMVGTYASGCAGGFSNGRGAVKFLTTSGQTLVLEGPYRFQWGPFGGFYQQEMGDREFQGGFAGFPTTGGPCTGDAAAFGGRADIAGGGYLSS